MKVVLYLCPEDELHTIIPLTPPFLVTSYLIHIYKEKGIKENEVFLAIMLIKTNSVIMCMVGEPFNDIHVSVYTHIIKKKNSQLKHSYCTLYLSLFVKNYSLYFSNPTKTCSIFAFSIQTLC